ncbi:MULTISPECIES: hypothetical protein [unclassified Novosphingobium]|uniref:hypothetical protein n=1 Tax=unclassified Novosphingobium TaxID=2644732 RepID=UPI00135C1E75|nr:MULTISPECIES: hypothetical protein [unclassified Novosphingobium]
MRGTKTMGVICVLAATAPTGTEARSFKVHGAHAVLLLPEQVQWTGRDRAAVDQAKAVDLVTDGGDAGWSLDMLALRSSRTGDADCCASGGHFNDMQMGMQAWHAVGSDDAIRLGTHLGKASRRTLSPAVFPAKSTAGYADAGLTWEHGDRWAVSTGWFRQGGWGGRRMDLDVVRMGNGEPAAASGMRAAVRLAVGGSAREVRSWLTLEAREGSRAACLGACAGGAMRHASDIGLTLNAMF